MHDDSAEAIARDINCIGRISAVPLLLKMACQTTGMGFAAVARVTAGSWTACAVEDRIAFGMRVGDQLPVRETLCNEARVTRTPVVVDAAGSDAVHKMYAGFRCVGVERYVSVPIVLPTGEYFGNLCAIGHRPAESTGTDTVGHLVVFADMIATQIRSERLHQQTDAALQREQAQAELREQSIAVLGHDLRDPLSDIGMMADLLRLYTQDAALLKLGHRLDGNVQRMLRMTEDMMDFARGRLGAGIEVDMRLDSHLSTSLSDLVKERRMSHPERDIEDRIAILVPVRCDPLRIQQLMSKLLDNALQYGAAERPVQIDVHTDADALHLAVRNGGRPIPPRELSHIFEPYWRPATNRPAGGLGLGLYLCAQIVKAHGGTLVATSSTAEGTCFRARLPLG